MSLPSEKQAYRKGSTLSYIHELITGKLVEPFKDHLEVVLRDFLLFEELHSNKEAYLQRWSAWGGQSTSDAAIERPKGLGNL